MVHHRSPSLFHACILSHACRKSSERVSISITTNRLTLILYVLSQKNKNPNSILKSCYSICFVLVGVIKYLFAILTCYINNFQLDNEKGIKVKCVKQVDSTKDRFNWIENDEIYYEEEEILCHLEPPYPPLIAEWHWLFLTVTSKILQLL